MSAALVVTLLVALLFALMAVRAFLSGSVADYLLAGVQGIGVLLLFSDYRGVASWLLLASAAAYLLSQILTGARPLSRLLPLAGGVMVVILLLL
jgi:hypothetical protein